VVVLAVVAGVYAFALARGELEPHARALTFATLIISDLSLIFTNRSWSRTIAGSFKAKNPWLWWVTLGTLAFLGLVIFVNPLAELFRFSALHPIDVIVATAAGLFSIAWFEIIKRFFPGPTSRRGGPSLTVAWSTTRVALPTTKWVLKGPSRRSDRERRFE
jgi:P-type Ca2+ transporter type 2C